MEAVNVTEHTFRLLKWDEDDFRSTARKDIVYILE